jgi:hypothetical protein
MLRIVVPTGHGGLDHPLAVAGLERISRLGLAQSGYALRSPFPDARLTTHVTSGAPACQRVASLIGQDADSRPAT